MAVKFFGDVQALKQPFRTFYSELSTGVRNYSSRVAVSIEERFFFKKESESCTGKHKGNHHCSSSTFSEGL